MSYAAPLSVSLIPQSPPPPLLLFSIRSVVPFPSSSPFPSRFAYAPNWVDFSPRRLVKPRRTPALPLQFFSLFQTRSIRVKHRPISRNDDTLTSPNEFRLVHARIYIYIYIHGPIHEYCRPECAVLFGYEA